MKSWLQVSYSLCRQRNQEDPLSLSQKHSKPKEPTEIAIEEAKSKKFKKLSLMAKYLFSLFLLLTTTATSAIFSPTTSPTSAPSPTCNTATTLTPTPTFAPTPPSTPTSNAATAATTMSLPPSSDTTNQETKVTFEEQLYNIIDAVLGDGDFKNWADVLTMVDPTTFPISATLFIPADDSLPPSITISDPFILPYHIVPQRLSFADLRQFKLFSRLPTLLLDKSILVTNNSDSNFTLDDSPLAHPDIYTNAFVAVHGIANILDYSVYGSEESPKPKEVAPPPTPPTPPPLPPPTMSGSSTAEDEESDILYRESDAPCLCTEMWTVSLIVCVVLASKLQRMSLWPLIASC